MGTTASCTQRKGKAETFTSYFASIFSFKGNELTVGKGRTKVAYKRIMIRMGQSLVRRLGKKVPEGRDVILFTLYPRTASHTKHSITIL